MNYELLVLVNGKETRKASNTITMDFSSIRVGADNLEIAQGGSGAGSYLNFGSKALRSSHVAADDLDLVNKVTLENAIASVVSGVEWQDSVLSRLDTPPASPSVGDRYLVIATATGDWTGKEDQIAEYTGSGWDYTIPTTGMAVLIDNEPTVQVIYGSTSWGDKYFESTTASGFLFKDGFDIQLKNLANGKIILGNESGVATEVEITGDVTISNLGVTAIGDSKVVEAKIANGAVTVNKIGNLAVSTAKIADDAVDKSKINADIAGLDLRQAADGSLELNSSKSYENDNAGSITARKVCYLKANGHVDLAKATIAGIDESLLLMVEDASIASGATGKLFYKPGKIVSGFTGLTPNKEYFLDNTTDGDIKLYADITFNVGEEVIFIGKAISATELLFHPEARFQY